MNALGQALVWCAIQVTLAAAVTLLVYLVLRRRGPAVRSLVALTGLSVSVALTLAAFSPWPRWPVGTANGHVVAPDAAAVSAADARGTTDSAAARDGSQPAAVPAEAPVAPGALDTARNFWQSLVHELDRRPAPAQSAAGWSWTGLVAILFVAVAALGLVRLAVATLLVGAYRRRSRRIDDPAVRGLVERLCADLDCRRKVELRECPSLASAAMLGWRRPLVLLPSEWSGWSESELRAVLAHEIAHIARGDFAAWVFAQVGLVLHFYHPLVHWLAARLRLDQELAADAEAARVAGGRQPYLRILADMALRQSDRLAAWPAHAFLPTRRTFLRRIEMLRATKSDPAALSRRLSAATVGLLVLVGLAAAGLRGSGGQSSLAAAQAQNEPAQPARPATVRDANSAAQRAAADALYTGFVPGEAQGFVAVRPAALLAHPGMKPFADFILDTEGMETPLYVRLDEIDQLSLTLIPPLRPARPGGAMLFPFGAMTVRTTRPHDFAKLIETFAPDATRIPAGGREYFKSDERDGLAYFRPDNRTLVIGTVQDITRMLAAGPETGWQRLAAGPTQRAISNAHYVAVVDTALVQEMLRQVDAEAGGQAAPAGRRPPPMTPQAAQMQLLRAAYAPLWEQAQSITFALTLGDRLSIEWLFDSKSEADAEAVRGTADALLTLGRNLAAGAAEMLREQAAGQPAEPMLRSLLQLGQELLDKAELEQDGTHVRLATSGGLAGEEANAIAALTESAKAARAAARRTQSMNNLKQIGLALHNYHDVYKRFPPAVLYNADGTVPHSWRVAILPYVDAAPLYNAYRFDEPWDSPHNRQILAQMPAVFRHPDAPADSTNAAYFGLVGESTIFTGAKAPRNEAGVRLRDITDGTSNTLLVVETKRDIPWTKPEDIPFDPEKDLPKLGGYTPGGFNALFGDGSVRFLSSMIDPALLKALITRAGGEPIRYEDLEPRRR